MFGRYALPSDDLAGTATDVSAIGGSPTNEDPDYPAENLIAPTNTGHLNLPSRPAKLDGTSGGWILTFASGITIRAAAIIYHNFDEGLDVTLDIGGGSPSIPFVIPAHHEDGWPVSPWVEFDPVTTTSVSLTINGTNSLPLQVGRLLLLGELRQLASDVRWGVEEVEEYGLIEHGTELGVETMYDLGGKRRSFSGEFGMEDAPTNELITLFRSARIRIQPWLLIPDEDVNDAWFVRFEENRWSRVRDNPNFNVLPFRVKELSRGLPWP